MMDLLQWWNLIFLLPLLCAALYHLLLAVGAVSADHDADHDAELDAHADVGLDHGIEHTTIEAHGHHGEGALATRPLESALTLLGIGRVPLSIVVLSWCYIWGVVGYASNQILAGLFPSFLFVWVSLGLAAVSAVVLTRYLALGLARMLPKTESYGVYTRDLVGRPAIVRHRVTATFGSAQVYDQYGTMHEVDCRTRPNDEPIPAGTQVALVDFDETKQLFIAVPI